MSKVYRSHIDQKATIGKSYVGNEKYTYLKEMYIFFCIPFGSYPCCETDYVWFVRLVLRAMVFFSPII